MEAAVDELLVGLLVEEAAVAGELLMTLVELASLAEEVVPGESVVPMVVFDFAEEPAVVVVVVMPMDELVSEVVAAGKLLAQGTEQWVAHCGDSEVGWSAK